MLGGIKGSNVKVIIEKTYYLLDPTRILELVMIIKINVVKYDG